MAEILETLENNGQLGKVLYKLLGQIATSAALKANENNKNASSSINGQTLPVCKSVPILPSEGVRSAQILRSLNNQRQPFKIMAGSPPDARESFALYYRTYGGEKDNKGCPLVVIHGLLGSTINWHEFCESYSELTGRKIISVDCRNHGQSPRNNLMTYPLMAGDVAETLKQLNISRAIVIGHSMGCRVAMELALTMPDSVEKLVLEDLPPMATPNPFASVVLSAMLNLDLTRVKTNNDADDVLKESIPMDFIRAYVLTGLHEDEEGKFHWLTDVRNLQKNTEPLMDGKEASIELKGRAPYTGETLFIAGGESDDLKNADMNEIRQMFPKAELHVIPGATHFVHTDKPQEFIEIVHNFLE